MATVLVIGGHGTLGRPVVRCLVAAGFDVRAMARDPDAAWQKLPPEVEVVAGDLQDVSSIRIAAQGCDIVHINLSTMNHKAPFRPELDGTHKIIEALQDKPEILLSKVTAYGSRPTSGWWPDIDQKFYTEHAIMGSGHPWLIWRPTWFFESLPMFVRSKAIYQPVPDSPPLYWVAGHDYGTWVAKAFAEPTFRNRFFYVQGSEAIRFPDAVKRFRDKYDPRLKLRKIPSAVLQMGALFSPRLNHLKRLAQDTRQKEEVLKAEETWELLGPPTMSLEQYVDYMQTTADIPAAP